MLTLLGSQTISQGSRTTGAGRDPSRSGESLAKDGTNIEGCFAKIGLSAGLEKDKLGNVFFIAHTDGFASHGASKGLVQCVSGKDHENAYLPCVEQYEHGQQGQHDGYQGYSYRKLTQNWYIFEQWD
jgi:hypothetical protein